MDNHFIIVIGGRNNSQWVEANLNSVLSQTYTNYEAIFFDDASEDDTFNKAVRIINGDKRFVTHRSFERKYKTWFFEKHLKNLWDNHILVFLDGDDFLYSENVLTYINSVYNQTDCWMTYGGMRVWDGVNEELIEPHPQNTQIPDIVKNRRAYRQDTWRTSHLKTMRGFIWNSLNKKQDLMPTGVPMVGPDDLAIMFGALERCRPDKIYRVSDPLYVYNHSEQNQFSRAHADHKETKIDYEKIVRENTPYEPMPFVAPTLAGGLGNQMFEIAAAASLAKDNNAVLLVNPDEHILPNQGRNVNNYRDNIFSQILFDRRIPNIENFYKRDICTYEPIPYKPNIKLMGHFQSWKYFDHNREYIRKLFTPTEIQLLETTAIQVRRGDYYKFPDHHPQLTPEYYAKAVKMAGCKDVAIFSDDIPWCKENLKFDDDVKIQYITGQPDWMEMCRMMGCKNLIISNSSFGWWAAYLNRHPQLKVYVPSIWFGKVMMNQGFKIEDLILPEWIKIDV